MKLFEKDWYWRKWVVIINWLLPKQITERIILIHKIKSVFNYTFHKKLSIKHPKDFNEKLIWLSLYWQHPLKALCADKFKVRDYVTGTCGLPIDILVPLIQVYHEAADIEFDMLPSQFVLKCNHGCGYNLIVKDKSKFDEQHAIDTLNKWILESYLGAITEFHYTNIMPHLILCEQYLPSLGNASIIDYKIHCFNGQPEFVLVCYNRNEDQEAELATFSFDWEQLYYVVDEREVTIVMPRSLDKMLEYSRILSKIFPFVRVDFYDVEGKPLFGELTFTPYGNMITYYKPEVLDSLGKKLTLPKKYKDA